MDTYHKILKSLNISDTFANLIDQKIEIPILDDYNNISTYWYQHPPCLIPIFLGYGAEYKGILNHFFSNRKNTLIEYYLEFDYFYEIARNEEQLYTIMIANMIVLKDEITQEIINFCNKIGYKKLDNVDGFTLKYGTNFQEYKHLFYLEKDTPSAYIKKINDYNGDYPTTMRDVNLVQVNNACYYEIGKEGLEKITEKPLWLIENTDKKDLFNYYLNNNQLKEAWLTLNSKGWLMSDVPNSLLELNKKGKDDLLRLVADNWIKNYEKYGVKGMYY